MSRVDVKAGVRTVLKQIDDAFLRRPTAIKTRKPLLVAVSKTKPVSMILDVYSTGQRHFGENYVQELYEKANNKEILEQCKDIKWHFIGHLQRNKIGKLMQVPNLYMVETIDSQKLASSLNTAYERAQKTDKQPLKVLVQVNTSKEDAKNGVSIVDAFSLLQYIKEDCGHLSAEGIMTIGQFGFLLEENGPPNPDFVELMTCHSQVCTQMNRSPDTVHVSMGMSSDFEHAIELGSTMVRVGSSIFGYRQKTSDDPINNIVSSQGEPMALSTEKGAITEKA